MEGQEKKRNVLLLTVIAIATMIVVVVGATFAYLASSIDTSDTSEIEATTNATSDSLIINSGGNMAIEATTDNFSQDHGDLSDSVTASVFLETAGANAEYKYKMFLEVNTNDFEYTSGTCYEISTPTGDPDKATCMMTPTNLWAKAYGESSYACYTTSNPVANPNYTDNEKRCLTGATYMWAMEEVPELVLDIMEEVPNTTETACIDDDTVVDSIKGTCVNNDRQIVAAANKQACQDAGNSWIANAFENGICYRAAKSYDVTTLLHGTGEMLEIYDSVTISATDVQSTIHNYRAQVTMQNLNHNQIVNGNKTFLASLTIEVIPDTGS